VADWSRGRILAGFLTPDGGTYDEEQVDFVLGTPMNVTDLEVGPDGLVYFSKGGRNTEGGLYRVLYGGSGALPVAAGGSPIDRALSQPQPRPAFGRAAIARAREEAGSDWGNGLRAVVSTAGDAARRARALELLQVTGDPL